MIRLRRFILSERSIIYIVILGILATKALNSSPSDKIFSMAEDAEVPGEGGAVVAEDFPKQKLPSVIEEIIPKKLTFEEATKCLNTLGKDESGCRYAYIMLTATNMKLTDISTVLSFKHVLFLDVGGNFLTTEALEVLTKMPFLIMLKADKNRVESLALSPMYYLQVLILSQNQIQVTRDIDQPLLESLDLNHNSIYETEFATARLDNLKQLEMRSNLLFDISGTYPASLEKLYLPANKISTIDPMELGKLRKLQVLHLRENNLTKLDGFSDALAELKYLNLRTNKLAKLKEFFKLTSLPKLETLVVLGNPLPGADTANKPTGGEDFGEGGGGKDMLLLSLLVILPNLKRINKTTVTFAHRIEAEAMHDAIMETIYAEDVVSVTEKDEGSILTSEYKTESESERNDLDL